MLANIATIRDPAATQEARGQATGYLALKVVIVLVIAYVVLQEFSQLQSMTSRSSAEACSARQKLLIDNMPTTFNLNDEKTLRYRQWKEKYEQFQRECGVN